MTGALYCSNILTKQRDKFLIQFYRTQKTVDAEIKTVCESFTQALTERPVAEKGQNVSC